MIFGEMCSWIGNKYYTYVGRNEVKQCKAFYQLFVFKVIYIYIYIYIYIRGVNVNALTHAINLKFLTR